MNFGANVAVAPFLANYFVYQVDVYAFEGVRSPLQGKLLLWVGAN